MIARQLFAGQCVQRGYPCTLVPLWMQQLNATGELTGQSVASVVIRSWIKVCAGMLATT